MATLAARALPRVRGEVFLAALVATVGAAVLVTAGPPAGDAPAHLYRTFLVHHGVHVWDNLWFAGQYPLVSYSLLYYFAAATIGNVPLVFASVVASAALFARLAEREWGEVGRWPSRAFALVAIGPLFTGTYSYAVGFACLLGCLVALQDGRTWLAVGAAGLTLGFSPLAFAFLCLVLAAVVLERRRVSRRMVVVGAGLALLAAVQLTALAYFPSEGTYPFRLLELVMVLSTCALGAALASREPRARFLAAFFLCWAVVSVVGFLVPSPFGENLTRLRAIAFPLMLLTALLTRFRPRLLAAAALGLALVWNVAPYALAARRIDARTSKAAFWTPALSFLRAHSTPDYRVEVVPTADHWEAYWVPRAGFALARGWYRQLDIAENRVLYRRPLTARGYRRWLRRMSVRYVLLPHASLGAKVESREAALLRSGRSGLAVAFRAPDWTIYELRRPRPLLSGPAPARVTALGHERVAGVVSAPGRYRLGVRYTRYWALRAGDVCLTKAADGMTELRARRPGRFVLSSSLGGGASCERA